MSKRNSPTCQYCSINVPEGAVLCKSCCNQLPKSLSRKLTANPSRHLGEALKTLRDIDSLDIRR